MTPTQARHAHLRGTPVRITNPVSLCASIMRAYGRLLGAGSLPIPRTLLDQPAVVTGTSRGPQGLPTRVLITWPATEENPSPGLWLTPDRIEAAS